MAVYKNSGSVTVVEVAYTDSLITHKLQQRDLNTKSLTNCQVHQTSMYTIQFKASYDVVKDKNCCKYDNFWYRIVDYSQLSTGYGMVTCEFSPLLSFLLCDKTGMKGIAMSTITKNPMLATNVSNYPTVVQIGLKQNDNIKLASNVNLGPDLMNIYVALSLPPTLVNANFTETSLSDWTSHAVVSDNRSLYYQDTGVIIVRTNLASDGAVGSTTQHSIVDALTIIASDPLYVGCVVDVWIDMYNPDDVTNGPLVEFSSSATYGLQGGMGASDSVQMQAVKRKPKILAKFKLPKPDDYVDSQTYNGIINITYNGETTSIPLYDITKKLAPGKSIYDIPFVVTHFPSVSSDGGSFEVGFQTYNDLSGYYVSLHKVNIPVIGLQPGINAAAAYWQNNKTRFELGQELTVAETLFSALGATFAGAGATLNAMAAGFIKFVANKATKEAILTDNARLSTGASGGSHEIFNPYWSIDLQRTTDDDLDKFLYYNPFTCYKVWSITENDAMSPIRLIDGNTHLYTWVQGVFNIPNLPNGNKKQRVLSMLQQGVSVNYNTGIGYQEG